MKEKVLIVDDEISICTSLTFALEDDYDVISANNAADGLRYFQNEEFSVCLLDLKIGNVNGIELLEEIRRIDERAVIIMMTAYASISSSVEAVKKGAYTYLTKPLDIQELHLVIERALNYRFLNERVEYLSQKLEEKNVYNGIIGKSPSMKNVFQLIEKVKNLDTSVLITGESGTGKELVARAIHYSGERTKHNFEEVNCAAIPEGLLEEELFGHKKGAFTGAIENKVGKFEHANHGTIFLDEIGDMSLALQAKLLRVLQQKEVTPVGSNETKKLNIRVIAATNRDLKKMVEEGSFRNDLYFRLKVIEIKLPALKERRQDIPLLCSHFIGQYNQEQGKNVRSLSKEAEKRLMEYGFPGNIRELSNILEYAMIMCDGEVIEAPDLPEEVTMAPKSVGIKSGLYKEDLSGLTLKEAEKQIILQALKENQWNRKKTAEQLGISDKGLRNKIAEYKQAEE